MAILGKGPGPKKKVTSKIGTNKEGQTVAANGYNMALVRKQNEPSTRTKTISGGPVGTKVTTPVGIYAPMPEAPAKKVAAAPAKKKTGLTAAGKAIRNVKEAVTSSGSNKSFMSTRAKISRSKKTGKSCY